MKEHVVGERTTEWTAIVHGPVVTTFDISTAPASSGNNLAVLVHWPPLQHVRDYTFVSEVKDGPVLVCIIIGRNSSYSSLRQSATNSKHRRDTCFLASALVLRKTQYATALCLLNLIFCGLVFSKAHAMFAASVCYLSQKGFFFFLFEPNQEIFSVDYN